MSDQETAEQVIELAAAWGTASVAGVEVRRASIEAGTFFIMTRHSRHFCKSREAAVETIMLILDELKARLA